MELDPGIGVFSAYRSILTSMDSLAKAAGQAPKQPLPESVRKQADRGLLRCCVHPRRASAGPGLKPPIMFEVFGETARGWRDHKLMGPMLATWW